VVGEREHSDDAFHRFCGVDSMQSGKHQVPVSEASSAISIVSRSRISPTRITFGPVAMPRAKQRKVGVSLCSSRWWIVAFCGDAEIQWIFDGQYVIGLLLIHFVKNGGKRG